MHGGRASSRGYGGEVSQLLEHDLVTIAAAIQTRHEHHRPAQRGGRSHRAGREFRRGTQEIDDLPLVGAESAIAQHADEGALIQIRVDPEHRIHATQVHDVELGRRVDGGQLRVDLVGRLLVHRHGHSQARMPLPDSACDFEAPEVSAHQECALAGVDIPLYERLAFDADLQQIVLRVDQVHTIMDRGGEREHLTEPVARRRFAAQRSTEVVVRLAPRARRKREKIRGDEVQKEPPGTPPDAERDESHDAQQEDTAALAPCRPFREARLRLPGGTGRLASHRRAPRGWRQA